jgi:hypothetical protein
VGQQVVEANLQSIPAGRHTERAAIAAVEDPGLLERGDQCRSRSPVGPSELVIRSVVDARRRRLVGEDRSEYAIHTDQMVDEPADGPIGARG